MPANQRTFWWCGGKDGVGHVVGELAYVNLRVGRVTALLLYEDAQDELPGEVPPLRQRLIGTALDIQCTCCGNQFDWYAGQATLNRMLNNMKMRNYGMEETNG